MQSKSLETNDSSVFAGKAVRRDAESYREDNPVRGRHHYDDPSCDNRIRGESMKLSCIIVIASWAVLCSGQEVHTSQVKDGVNLSISSPQSYVIIAGE